MKLIARPIDLEVGGKNIVIMNKEDMESLGLHSLDRVKIKYEDKELTAIVDETAKFTLKGEIVTNEDVTNFFSLKGGEHLEVLPEKELESIIFIKQKLSGARLEYPKIKKIVEDIVKKKISSIELTAFVTALYTRGLTIDEAANLSKAMVETGKKIPNKIVELPYLVLSDKKATVRKVVEMYDISDPNLAVGYAQEAIPYGLLYIEGTGGTTVDLYECLKAIKRHYNIQGKNIQIIYGGGISDGDTARRVMEAGASTIVVGNILYEDKEKYSETIEAAKDFKRGR